MKETAIKKIEELEELGRSFETKLGFVFRGQGCAKWDLATTLERHCDRLMVPVQDLEPWIYNDFKRQAANYIDGNTPSKDETIDWLSLMRHHGAPSRLLDFSCSFWIAVFFALESAESEFAVFAVNLDGLFKTGIGTVSKSRMSGVEIVSNSILGEDHFDPPFVFGCSPNIENQRFASQQGHFLVGTSSKTRFHDAIEQMDQKSENRIIEKFILDFGLQHQLLYKLASMNISMASLMPGLDGFARSLCNPRLKNVLY